MEQPEPVTAADYMRGKSVWQALYDLCDWLDEQPISSGYENVPEELFAAIEEIHSRCGRGD